MKYLFAALLLCLAWPAQAEILIGVSAPLTGAAASISEVTLPGLKQAVADINAHGGFGGKVGGELLKLEILDDACDPKQAVAVAGKLVARQPAAVIGLSCSGSTQAAAPVYEDEGVPFIVALASNPDISRYGYRTLIRPASRDDQDAAAAVAYLAVHAAGKKIAIVDDKEAWGKGLADLIAQGLASKGFQTVTRLQINPGDQDYSAVAARLKNEQPDVVYVAALMRETGLFVRQLNQVDFDPTIMGSINMYMPDALAVIGAARQGIIFTRVTLSSAARDLAHKLDSGNDSAGIYNIQAYAAVQVLAQAVTRVGHGKDQAPDALLADLHKSRFETVLGPLVFNAQGDIADLPFEVMQYRGGKAVKVQQ